MTYQYLPRCKQVNKSHFKCNNWFVFHIFRSNFNFNVEIGQLFYTNVLLIYNMETCGMIGNESNEGRLFKNIH